MTWKQKTTILFIDHSRTIGGSTKVLLNLLDELNRSAVEPIVACGDGSDVAPVLKRKNISTVTFSMPWFTKRSSPFTWAVYAYSLIRFGLSVASMIKSLKAACIHANGFIAALYSLLPSKLANVPLVLHMHEILEQGRINGFFVRIAAARADRIICVSGAVKQRLLEFGVTEAKCEVVYNFIGEPGSSHTDRPVGFRAEFNIVGNASLVGMIGNISPLKGQMVFVEAVQKIAERRPNTVYVIVGDTITAADERYKRDLLGRINAGDLRNRVILTGFRSDAFRVLREFDILVHPPTLPESLGLVLLEAMYHGKPVIASDIGGIPEVVTGGVTGVLVKPRDPDELAQAIGDLLDRPDLRSHFGKQGKRILSERFDRKRIVEQLNDLYNRVLSKTDGHQRTYYNPR